MIRALLDGRKTQTRRVLKPQPVWKNGFIKHPDWSGYGYETGEFFAKKIVNDSFPEFIKVQTGDHLWVRESWRVGAWHYGNAEIALDYRDGPRKEWLEVEDSDFLIRLINQSRVDAGKENVPLNELTHWEYTWTPGNSPCRWRPSIHMPRWASRITLKVTDIRVQRLQDISDQDAIAEGLYEKCWEVDASQPNVPDIIGIDGWSTDRQSAFDHGVGETARDGFSKLWNSINGLDAWDANPWVVAYSFDVIPRNIDDQVAA
jgi:hypothetical protein